MLNEILQNEIIAHAESSSYEVCGFIKKEGEVFSVEKKENLLNSATEFIMEGAFENIYAYYHSHINYDQISKADEIVSERLKLPCIVYNKSTKKFHQYNPNGIKIKYTERPFVLGFADCLWLVKDYYRHDLNINLISEQEIAKNNVSEEEYSLLLKNRCVNEANLLKNENNYLKRYFELNGFHEVSNMKKNDILISRTQEYKFPIHCMIYLGKDAVLHHPGDGISKVETLSSQKKKWVKYIMRHNLL